MNAELLLIVVLISIVMAIVVIFKKNKRGEVDYPYQKRDSLFTPAERSFFGVLKRAVGNDVEVFGKVRVADVLTPKKGMSRSEWQKAFNKISGKHFDFLLCNKNDLSIICAIELNDSSHQSKKRKDRDSFLKRVCVSSNVPLIQVSAKAAYNIDQIRNLISPYISGVQSNIYPSSEGPAKEMKKKGHAGQKNYREVGRPHRWEENRYQQNKLR